MGISNIFDIASSGIAAQRIAIEVAGENVANVNTQGYAKQSVVMTNTPGTSIHGFLMGSGVAIQTIQRSYDGMLQQQIVNGNSTYQQNLTRQTALQQIQPSFNEVSTDGLGKAMENFFGAWQDLTNNPGGAAERQSLLSNSQNMVDTFHQMSSTLTNVAGTADRNLAGIASDVSDNAKNLAMVNTQIVAAQALGTNPNELMNQRDLLIQKIAEKVGITSTIASDGTATLTVAGPGGSTPQLVSGGNYATLYTNPNGGGTNDIMLTAAGNPPPAPTPGTDTNVSATIGGAGNSLGEMGGTLQVRDSIVPGYLSQLNEMASKLVSSVNAQHAAGYGLDGTTGNNFFAAAGTTAATIALDPALTAAKIAAALPTATDPAPTSAANNVNATKIADIQNQTFTFSTGNANFASYYSALVGKVGSDTQNAQNITSQGQSFVNQLNNLRQSNSGVSLDEELTNLTKYQQAYQGAAKVINVATEMLDTILGMVQ